MSDNLKYVMIVTEGPHDVEAVSKVLRLRGYTDRDNINDIPEALHFFIPKQYPFNEEGHMERGVPRPSFLMKEEKWAVIVNAGGISKIVKKLSDSLSAMHIGLFQMLCGIAIIADMDNSDQAARQSDFVGQMMSEMEEFQIEHIAQGKIEIIGEPGNCPVFFYFFPDNYSEGTLEMLLIEGARMNYSDLLGDAQKYIEKAKKNYPLQNYDELKATVGAIANVLKPGKANQVSIHDNHWFTADSLEKIENHKRFAEFVCSVISLMVD